MLPKLKLSDFPTPGSPQPSAQFSKRLDHVVLHHAQKAKSLEADFAVNAEAAMTVAMCKLELCLRDQQAGGSGEVDRQIPAAPAERTPAFFVNGTVYRDELTKFDAPLPDPLPSTPLILLSNRRLVISAILGWKSPRHIGTSLDITQASLLLGGHYALLTLALSLGVSVFVYIASLLLTTGVPVSFILLIPGAAAVLGFGYGFLTAQACHAGGDHDMAMMGLFPIIYRYGSLLDAPSYDHILHNLLANRVSGSAAKVHEIIHVCGKKVLPSQMMPSLLGETENHILMIETARYLTNQLLLLPNPFVIPTGTPTYNPDFDNTVNGMRTWMLKHLQKYLQNDFYEFNSRAYARFIPVALQNLYEFSADPEVRKAARMVLDYLSAKFAVTSNRSRRAVPFRRTPDKRDKTLLFDEASDEETWRFLMLVGDTSMLGQMSPDLENDVLQLESYTLVFAGLGPYEVPLLLENLILSKNDNRYLQLIRHGKWDHGYGDAAMEITFNSGTYLITGGGLFANGRGDEQAWALPTTLMPTLSIVDTNGEPRSMDWQDFIRIEGTPDAYKRANTGVAPGFACGLNPVIPLWLRLPIGPQHIDQHGPWTFINCASDTRPFGFFVTVFQSPCNTIISKELAGQDGTFGFFAVAETDMPIVSENTFEEFKAKVLALNESKTYTSEGINNFAFPAGMGANIEFVCLPTQNGAYNPLLWPIVSLNGAALERDLNKMDLAASSVFTAAGLQTSLEDWIIQATKNFGCIMIDNPALDERLVLDFSDAMNPRTAYVKGQRFTAGCRCPLSNECTRRHPIK